MSENDKATVNHELVIAAAMWMAGFAMTCDVETIRATWSAMLSNETVVPIFDPTRHLKHGRDGEAGRKIVQAFLRFRRDLEGVKDELLAEMEGTG